MLGMLGSEQYFAQRESRPEAEIGSREQERGEIFAKVTEQWIASLYVALRPLIDTAHHAVRVPAGDVGVQINHVKTLLIKSANKESVERLCAHVRTHIAESKDIFLQLDAPAAQTLAASFTRTIADWGAMILSNSAVDMSALHAQVAELSQRLAAETAARQVAEVAAKRTELEKRPWDAYVSVATPAEHALCPASLLANMIVARTKEGQSDIKTAMTSQIMRADGTKIDWDKTTRALDAAGVDPKDKLEYARLLGKIQRETTVSRAKGVVLKFFDTHKLPQDIIQKSFTPHERHVWGVVSAKLQKQDVLDNKRVIAEAQRERAAQEARIERDAYIQSVAVKLSQLLQEKEEMSIDVVDAKSLAKVRSVFMEHVVSSKKVAAEAWFTAALGKVAEWERIMDVSPAEQAV
jgi:hypothetical protein